MKKQDSNRLLFKTQNQDKDFPEFSILLVEDHTMVRLLAKQFLIKQNFKVDAVEDGESALLLAISKPYDLILMDLKLPNLDGFDTTKIIRTLNNSNATIPILALTSSAKDEVREQMKEAGLTDYIGKPFESKELLQKIQIYTNKNQKQNILKVKL